MTVFLCIDKIENSLPAFLNFWCLPVRLGQLPFCFSWLCLCQKWNESVVSLGVIDQQNLPWWNLTPHRTILTGSQTPAQFWWIFFLGPFCFGEKCLVCFFKMVRGCKEIFASQPSIMAIKNAQNRLCDEILLQTHRWTFDNHAQEILVIKSSESHLLTRNVVAERSFDKKEFHPQEKTAHYLRFLGVFKFACGCLIINDVARQNVMGVENHQLLFVRRCVGIISGL